MKKIAMMSGVLAAVTLGTVLVVPAAVHADTKFVAPESVSGGSLWDMSGKITGDTTVQAPIVNDIRYVSNEQILNALKVAQPAVYAKLSQATIDSLLVQDQLRQGGTYIKSVNNGYRIYLNSAVFKLFLIGGAVAIAPTFGYLGGLIGLKAGTINSMSTAAGTALGWAHADRGIWFEYDWHGQLRNSGFQ